MRKILATAAALGLAGLGVLVPATSAQASTACNNAYNSIALGNFIAWDGTNCGGTRLGITESWDSDWGNSSGPFQGSDTNRASSVMHKGATEMRVQLFNGTGQDWAGGHTCLTQGEKYMSSLAGQYFTSGVAVNDEISSHRWIWSGCGAVLDS
ncbi:hypothetical protein [Streptomyces cyaneofuscatus]|uniref:hypothetical protein n=1 Tax=Streptomyces cyaneofuscatus TaxID=66883 RepID=UPI003668639A